MFYKYLNGLAICILKEAVRDDDREKAHLAWELMHLHQILHGFDFYKPNPEVPPLPPVAPFPWSWNIPFPDPTPWNFGHSDVLVELLAAISEPNPQPSRPSFLTDTEIRRDAAKSLLGGLQRGIERLEQRELS